MRLGAHTRLPISKFFSSASPGRIYNVVAEDGPFWLTAIGFNGGTSTGEIRLVADGTDRAVIVPAAVSDLGYSVVRLNVPFKKNLDVISSASLTNFYLYLEVSRTPNELPEGPEETKYIIVKTYSFTSTVDTDPATGGKVVKRLHVKPGSDVTSLKLVIDDTEYELSPQEFSIKGYMKFANRLYVHGEASAATSISMLMEVIQ